MFDLFVDTRRYRVKKSCRSSRPVVLCKKGDPRNFAKFTGKHLYQSHFFNKVAGLRPTTLLKKRLWHRCFPVNFVKFVRTPCFTEHLWTTASESSKQYAYYRALTIVDLPKLSRRFHPTDTHEIFD